MSKKRWLISDCDKELAVRISQDCEINPYAALIAVARGVRSEDDVRTFFGLDDAPLSSPDEFADMDKAVQRINRAIDSFERIAVFGDYDADGVTATALLCNYLEMREANFFYSLPTRDEGYGLTRETVDKLKSMGANLIVTVDNGISSVDEVEYASSMGIDTVVTDHHRAGDEIPDACAVVNPHRQDCPSSFKELAGVGVAFKLVCALEGGECEELLDEYSDLVTIGTIGDIVPLLGENRTIVRSGIERMSMAPRPGITALRAVAGNADKPLNAITVAFTLAPRLNAAGRMGSAERALELLLCDDEETASLLAEEIEAANISRQRTEQEIFNLAQEQLAAFPERQRDPVIICDGEEWHNGVIGIVASRMVEKYGRPCIIISRSGDTARGSGRSIEGFSLYDALNAVSGCLIKFGGHTQAAGLGIESGRIEEFRRAMNEYAYSVEMPFPIQRVDLRLNPKCVGLDILEGLSELEPFGAGNPQPVFGLFRMRIDNITSLSGGKHIRLSLSKKDVKLSAVRFGMSPEQFPFRRGHTVDLAVTLAANDYQGETRVGVYIKAMRFSDFLYDEYFDGLRAYNKLSHGIRPSGDVTGLVPDRQFVGNVYKQIKNEGSYRSVDELCADLGETGRGICSVRLSADALCELGLVSCSDNGAIEFVDSQKKTSLDDSPTLTAAREAVKD